jgi:LDH2 family malate/lactate/ureidoglycolate dehydrogenase
MGTNPICFGFPTTQHPYIMDMGTAALMWGELMLHAHLGQPIPEGMGFDENEYPTTDAAAALRGGVAPFGSHKGFGLSLVMQSFGVLAGAAFTRGRVQDFGFFFVVIDPKILIPDGSFPKLMTEINRFSSFSNSPAILLSAACRSLTPTGC